MAAARHATPRRPAPEWLAELAAWLRHPVASLSLWLHYWDWPVYQAHVRRQYRRADRKAFAAEMAALAGPRDDESATEWLSRTDRFAGDAEDDAAFFRAMAADGPETPAPPLAGEPVQDPRPGDPPAPTGEVRAGATDAATGAPPSPEAAPPAPVSPPTGPGLALNVPACEPGGPPRHPGGAATPPWLPAPGRHHDDTVPLARVRDGQHPYPLPGRRLVPRYVDPHWLTARPSRFDARDVAYVTVNVLAAPGWDSAAVRRRATTATQAMAVIA